MNIKSINDNYNFYCHMCGECCTGNTEMYLNLYDLYKLCVFLKFDNTKELFERGLVKPVIAENNSWIPRLQFRKKPLRFCPFLINDLDDDFQLKCYCRLHPQYKPLACRMAPVGRVIDCSTGETGYVMMAPVQGCSGMTSSKLNKIEDLENELRGELDYDYRFFMILDAVLGTKIWTSEITAELYHFPVTDTFEYVLEHLEQVYCASGVV